MQLQAPQRTTLPESFGNISERNIRKLCSHLWWGATGNENATAMWKNHFEALMKSSKNSNIDTFVTMNISKIM